MFFPVYLAPLKMDAIVRVATIILRKSIDWETEWDYPFAIIVFPSEEGIDKNIITLNSSSEDR